MAASLLDEMQAQIDYEKLKSMLPPEYGGIIDAIIEQEKEHMGRFLEIFSRECKT